MANFTGVSGITEIEAKVARIIEDFFWKSNPESFFNWTKQNDIKFLNWWDYMETKQNTQKFDLIPFNNFKDLFDVVDIEGSYCSLRYLKITREMSLTILTLGYIPV